MGCIVPGLDGKPGMWAPQQTQQAGRLNARRERPSLETVPASVETSGRFPSSNSNQKSGHLFSSVQGLNPKESHYHLAASEPVTRPQVGETQCHPLDAMRSRPFGTNKWKGTQLSSASLSLSSLTALPLLEKQATEEERAALSVSDATVVSESSVARTLRPKSASNIDSSSLTSQFQQETQRQSAELLSLRHPPPLANKPPTKGLHGTLSLTHAASTHRKCTHWQGRPGTCNSGKRGSAGYCCTGHQVRSMRLSQDQQNHLANMLSTLITPRQASRMAWHQTAKPGSYASLAIRRLNPDEAFFDRVAASVRRSSWQLEVM